MHRPLALVAALTGLLGGIVAFAYAQTANPIAQDQLLTYLDSLTQWQRDAADIEPSATNARELVFRDSVRENATKVLQSGFTFIRGVASTQPKAAVVDPESTGAKMTARAVQIKAHIAQLQARAGQPGVRDEIRLEEARLALVQTILANLNAASNKSPNKLLYTVDSLSRSIPELNPDATPAAKAEVKEEPSTTKRSAMSIISLGSTIFDVARKQRELDDVIAETTALKKQSMELMKTLRSGLDEASHDEAEEEKAEDQAPVAPLSVDERIEAYKRLGTHIVPLGETMRWIDASKQTLNEWRSVLEQNFEDLLRQLVVHLFVLVVSLAIPFVLSELARRSIKHVPDAKRQRQLHSVRRILLGAGIIIILLLNFLSDFSSFATFMGFMTAGIAFALQSVILSMVAHFLFYGRYGVRNGDRVHVAGVTGDIVQIGALRFYIRELRETEDGTLEPTGKTVAFPNSILFQNVAFYKYT